MGPRKHLTSFPGDSYFVLTFENPSEVIIVYLYGIGSDGSLLVEGALFIIKIVCSDERYVLCLKNLL